MLIAHASQYLTAADPALVHAVGFAARSGAQVRGIHVPRRGATEPSPPDVRGLLRRWGVDPTQLHHRWLIPAPGGEVSNVLLGLVLELKPGLLIVAAHARGNLERRLQGSVSENVARDCQSPVLFVPHDGPFVVSAQTGALKLDRALVLAGPKRDAQRAASALASLTKLAQLSSCAVELLHVEDGTPPPHPLFPQGFDITTRRWPGPIERAVVERAEAFDPHLIVMVSHGHDQLSDVMFSSHTERVLHNVRRPLLWVPAGDRERDLRNLSGLGFGPQNT